MASEYMILLGKSEDTFFDNGKTVAVFLAEGQSLTITSPDKKVVEKWGDYAENDPAWLDHSKEDAPLSSLFGRSGYTFGEWSKYDNSTKAEYDKAIKELGGTTKTFKPKKG